MLSFRREDANQQRSEKLIVEMGLSYHKVAQSFYPLLMNSNFKPIQDIKDSGNNPLNERRDYLTLFIFD